MDEIIRAVTGDGNAKIAVISGRDMVDRARVFHNLTPTTTAALGRTLLGASLLGDMLKEEKATLTIRINGGGPIGSIIAVSDNEGNPRGYVENPQADLPTRADGKLDVGGIVGKSGTLTVSRDLGMKEPYVGSSALVSGEIAEDLAYYFVESEQVPSACGLGVLVGTDFSVKCAGGFIVSLLPGAPDELIATIEANISAMGMVTSVLESGTADDIVNGVLKDLEPEILSRHEVEYRCYCSRERVQRAIASIGSEELEAIEKDGEDTEIVCHFCNTAYSFSPDEVREIINSLK